MTAPGWRYLALVAAGGSLGTATRWLVGRTLPAGLLPWPTLAVNLTGAFLLGLLLEGLALGSADGVPHRGWRLFAGTGFLGGLTTYSALAVDTDALARSAPAWLAASYGLGTLAGGLVLCWLGMEVAAYGVRLARGSRPEPAAREAEG